MKKKDYQKMTTKVVQLKHKYQILTGSVQSRQATLQDYGWETETEE